MRVAVIIAAMVAASAASGPAHAAIDPFGSAVTFCVAVFDARAVGTRAPTAPEGRWDARGGGPVRTWATPDEAVVVILTPDQCTAGLTEGSPHDRDELERTLATNGFHANSAFGALDVWDRGETRVIVRQSSENNESRLSVTVGLAGEAN